jgi:hypothetical protein
MKLQSLILPLAMSVTLSCCQHKAPVVETSEQTVIWDTADLTNDFYDNEPPVSLATAAAVRIEGEVAEPAGVSLEGLPVHSLIVKETSFTNNEVAFIGAYRYDGVSLLDLLNRVKVVKKNAAVFNPIIDLYVTVYGSAGDSAVFSWGEIYYPVNLHHIIIANSVTRIVPTKSKDKWPLPQKARLIAGTDLVTVRNISDPVRIVIRSLNVDYKVDRSIKLWSPSIAVAGIGENPAVVSELPENQDQSVFEHVFYGRGMGIHGITQTSGTDLKILLASRLQPTENLYRTGLLAVAGIDGYRCAVSWSEVFNRNDNAGVILRDRGKDQDGGRFSCLFTADFFSDRAIKSITEIRLLQGGGQ